MWQSLFIKIRGTEYEETHKLLKMKDDAVGRIPH